MIPTLEIYSSIECPFAYLAVYRLRKVWPEFAGKLQIAWRALALEYVNRRMTPKPGNVAEAIFIKERIEPGLPVQPWTRPEWQWPGTFWPAFEALACAQAQNPVAAFEMSWALRYAFFQERRIISLRHELFDLARNLAEKGLVDLARFESDWDQGVGKRAVISESQRGWEELKVNGSPTFILPGGAQVSDLAAGEIDLDEETGILHKYTPFQGDPMQAYRELLKKVIGR